MAQHLAYFIERGSAAKHGGRQAVAEHMRANTFRRHLEPRSLQGFVNDFVDGCAVLEAGFRIPHSNEDASRVCSPISTQVRCERSPYLVGQGQPMHDLAFPSDYDLARPPVDVFQREPDNFLSAQAEASKEQENGIVAATHRALAIAAL
jgi:hypothetical protein